MKLINIGGISYYLKNAAMNCKGCVFNINMRCQHPEREFNTKLDYYTMGCRDTIIDRDYIIVKSPIEKLKKL